MAHASTESNPRLDWRIVIAIAAVIAVGFYLLVSALTFRVGFPLDDAWIHLTYARNFAEHGEWAFRLGEKSAGSTSPLWTFILSIGYLLHLAPYVWTYFLGWLILTSLAIYAESSLRRLIESYKPSLPWIGFFFVFAWHLTWSALSGMETLLHGLLIFIVLVALINNSRRYLTLGLLAGLSVWVRPDGMTLLGPILFTALLSEHEWRGRIRSLLKVMIGFGALFLPYLLFNLAISGNHMPNTFYAKQAEYQAYWLGKSIPQRLAEYASPILAGPFLALIPAALMWIGASVRNRHWGTLAGVLWSGGYIFIYFLRLPAYQHGRYIIPALPILYFWGLLGFINFISRVHVNQRLAFFWQNLIAILCVVFTFIGARQNAFDVQWVETEMVATAQWVKQNLPADAVLAVHDVGAMGYFVSNPVVDLAGLVNPKVVAFIRDENRLSEYMDTESVDYLIVLPSFYPSLTSRSQPIFVGGQGPGSRKMDEHMQVYRWK